ncbi:glycosyltransferase family 4 protein [Acidisoma sp. L85]|uniref:glycosyltransferase family 4 protein n=1 Tax=Acidisoma sp. L85 TaxID=1641850 RepID=UPI00131EB391|nr:glycosyltransferase family 4 protein [Acidisoma sp. L85]
MLAISRGLKRSLTDSYLAGNAELIRRMLRGRSGGRDFSRVVIVAALARHNGITRGAYLQWEALRQIGVETELVDATPALRNPLYRIRHQPGSAYVFHTGGPQTASLVGSVLPHAASAYRIAYWAWELPDPPQDWGGCDRNVEEIWTPSAFSQASLAKTVQRPVHVVPHYLPPHPARKRDSAEPFTVLTMADSRSSFSRKNPEGAVRAFRRAFGTSPSARLILKLSGRDEELKTFEGALGHELRGDNIEVVRDYLDEAGLAALYRRADVLLSLHRAEGFGLPMLEAMAHGIPVVATGWSGNLEFADATNTLLVPYRLVAVSDPAGIYSGSTWAEPDLEAAAQGLRRLAEAPAFYAALASAAHRSVVTAAPRFPFESQRAVAQYAAAS